MRGLHRRAFAAQCAPIDDVVGVALEVDQFSVLDAADHAQPQEQKLQAVVTCLVPLSLASFLVAACASCTFKRSSATANPAAAPAPAVSFSQSLRLRVIRAPRLVVGNCVQGRLHQASQTRTRRTSVLEWGAV